MPAVTVLERGRAAYDRRAWADAFELLSRAAAEARDLERLATAAYMLGRDQDHVKGLERAHRAYLDEGEPLRAVRCAFWAGMCLVLSGEPARATGWFSRAQRLVERADADCVERGYLLLPQVKDTGDREAVHAIAAEAAAIGERHGDFDLLGLALMEQGRALVDLGRVADGLRLLDEAMVAVTAGEVSPIVTGLMYCSVIDGCQEAYSVSRAREWTAALSQWCRQQPQMVSFTGRCLVHRAEIMQLRGDWPDALTEADRAHARFEQGRQNVAAGAARYRAGELHRLRGELAAAEDAYRAASRCGWEPQPGLALLRVAQGRSQAAAAAIRRAAGERTEAVERAALLPAYVEVMLAVGDHDEARGACRELAALARRFESALLDASAAHARGAVALARAQPRDALVDLRRALRAWHELDAPYDAARTRVLVALACRAVGDEDTAAMELQAARAVFEELGAAREVARVRSLAKDRAAHEFTARELEVLRLVAAGETNKAIAARLVLSERTVDRHVSNILAKVGASSRAAATAYAYEHELV